MMSNKGAIKKTTEPKSQPRRQQPRPKPRAPAEAAEEKPERRKREQPQQVDARPRPLRAQADERRAEAPERRTRPAPDRRHQPAAISQQNAPAGRTAAGVAKKPAVSKGRAEGPDAGTRAGPARATGTKARPLYDEVRGTSSVYAPKDAAGRLRAMAKGVADKPKKPATRERKNSRTLSPSEVKVLKPEKPKAAKATKVEKEAPPAKPESDIDEDCDYEDDFEDYESDFEEYVSGEISEESDHAELSLELEPIELRTEEKKRIVVNADARKAEEEHMLDSGHYELAEARKRAAMVESLMANRVRTPPPLPELKEPINHSYREEKQSENKSLPSSTDEGFEDLRSGDFVKSPPITQVILVSPEKHKPEKMMKKPRKILTRGQILMNMIKLDTVEWSLYESKPISYDDFIRTYGKLNTQQTSTQTNEDNLDVEIQTDACELENKWTQFPVTCRSKLETVEDVRLFKMEHIGVGGDSVDGVSLASPSYDVLKMNDFLSRAGKVVLALLEEKEFGGNILQNETHEFPFSEGFVKLSISSLSFLCGRQVSMLCYSEINNKILMSIHAPTNEKIEPESKQDYIMDCCIGCVWNVNEPSRPIKLFYSQSPITACCFHCTNNNIIFAGLQDGSICLWDLREEETWHQKIIDKVNEMDWIVRSATYTTAGNWEVEAHKSSVVAIRIVSKMDQNETESLNDKFVSIQICSLDEEGRLIIWSVLRNLSTNTDDLGSTQWGKVKLVKSQEVPLFIKKNESSNMKKQFVDMNVDNADSNNLYLATNGTDILYANCIGGRNNTLRYNINEMDFCGRTTCIEVCPFKQSYFFAGCNDGSIRLHSLSIETPILKLKDENSSAGIKSIQWSKSKPLTVYVLDDHSRITVWDLSYSDIHPAHTVSTKTWGYVMCIRLSPCSTNRDMLNQYLALGTDTGNVEVHKLKKNFYFSQQNDFLQEMDTFLRYVSIL